MAEAARNLSAVGAEPIGVTNCLNFGSPERPEVMWAFAESVRGLGDACRALGAPVTGGNVSFYNESAGRSIHPTPVVGMVGIVADAGAPPLGFRRGGDLVVLLGDTRAELAGSEFRRILHGRTGGLPTLDLGAEAALGRLVRDAIARGMLASAHDCSDGGLAIALAEACLDAGVGATIGLAGAASGASLEPHVWLFSESAARMLVSLAPAHFPALQALARAEGVPVAYLGTVGGPDLVLDEVSIPMADLRAAHEETLPRAMGA